MRALQSSVKTVRRRSAPSELIAQSIRTDFNGLLAMQFMMPPPQTAPRNGDTGSAFVEFTVRRQRSLVF